MTQKVKHISASSLGAWEECKRKFHRNYVLKDYREGATRNNLLGNFVHEILEHLYQLPPKQRDTEAARKIAGERFEELRTSKAWGLVVSPDSGFVRNFKVDAWNSVLNALDMEDATEVQAVGTEVKLEGLVAGVPFKGAIDRLDDEPDGYVVKDYKNGKVPTYPNAKKTAARQIVLYGAALRDIEDKEAVRGELVYTNAQKIVPVRLSPKLFDGAGELLNQTWEDIGAEEEWAPTTSALCGWCPYLDVCDEGRKAVLARMREGKSVSDPARQLLS